MNSADTKFDDSFARSFNNSVVTINPVYARVYCPYTQCAHSRLSFLYLIDRAGIVPSLPTPYATPSFHCHRPRSTLRTSLARAFCFIIGGLVHLPIWASQTYLIPPVRPAVHAWWRDAPVGQRTQSRPDAIH